MSLALRSTSYHMMLNRLGGRQAFQGEVHDERDQTDFEVYRPKGPEPTLVKQFNRFLKLLAKSLGVSEKSLRDKGYRCEYNGGETPRLSIPNSDHSKLFKQFGKGVNPVHLFQKPNFDKKERHHIPSLASPWAVPRPRGF